MKRDKLKSRTFWLTVFCMVLAAVWGTISLAVKYNPAWLTGTMPTLIGVIIAYISGNKFVAAKGNQCADQKQDPV